MSVFFSALPRIRNFEPDSELSGTTHAYDLNPNNEFIVAGYVYNERDKVEPQPEILRR